MLADVVLRLPNNPKSEEKGEINRTLNPKRMIKNVGGGNCKTASYDSIIHPQASRISPTILARYDTRLHLYHPHIPPLLPHTTPVGK
jgi:hypothetical protein